MFILLLLLSHLCFCVVFAAVIVICAIVFIVVPIVIAVALTMVVSHLTESGHTHAVDVSHHGTVNDDGVNITLWHLHLNTIIL